MSKHRTSSTSSTHLTSAVVPIVPGQAEAWRRWTQELAGSRQAEFAASCQRLGVTRLIAWSLEGGTQGDVVVLLIESSDPQHGIPLLATSREPFDLWIKQRIRELHGIDLEAMPVSFGRSWSLPGPTGSGHRHDSPNDVPPPHCRIVAPRHGLVAVPDRYRQLAAFNA